MSLFLFCHVFSRRGFRIIKIISYLLHFLRFLLVLAADHCQPLERPQNRSRVLPRHRFPDIGGRFRRKGDGVQLEMTERERGMMFATEELSQLRKAVDGGGGRIEIRRSHQMVEERRKGADERTMMQQEVFSSGCVHGFTRFSRGYHKSGGKSGEKLLASSG